MNFPNKQDLEHNVATMHDKFWDMGKEPLRKIWREQRIAMEARDGKD
jgi:hypothetical protein